MLNKKGGLTDFQGDVLAFLFFILSALVFFLLFSVTMTGCHKKGVEATISSRGLNQLSQEIMLINYLRTRTGVGSEYLTFAELIFDAYAKDNYAELDAKTKAFFADLDTEDKCSSVCVDVGGNREYVIRTEACKRYVFAECAITKAEIPLRIKDRLRNAVVSLSYDTFSYDQNPQYGEYSSYVMDGADAPGGYP
ncbi:MAG: hypothetical protein ABIG95_05815 [Candidatus Woesearchaeota archaeon]